jgi:hypothetical protein
MDPAATALDFLLVSNNHETLMAVTGGLEQIGVRLNFAPSCEGGRDYIARHKVDGVIVDLDVPGAQAFILFIRQSISNRNAVVFACLPRGNTSPAAVVPGATSILPRPLTSENVASQILAVRNSMLGERRRFFRYRVSFPVRLRSDSGEQRVMMTSLGEGGMAAYAVKPIERFGLIEFEFDLPSGTSIAGKGSIAWANDEGMLGIKFLFLRDHGEETLQNWCRQQASS